MIIFFSFPSSGFQTLTEGKLFLVSPNYFPGFFFFLPFSIRFLQVVCGFSLTCSISSLLSSFVSRPPSARLGKVESLKILCQGGKQIRGKKRKMPFSGTGRGLWGVGVCCSIHQSEKQKTKLKNSDFVEILLMAIFSSLFMQSMAPNLILLLTLIGGIYDFYSNVKFPSCQRPSGQNCRDHS